MPKNLQPDYETYRIAIRKIASNTNERTLITTVIPPNAFAGNSLTVHFPYRNLPQHYNELVFSYTELLFLVSVMNSFVADYILRSRMTTNLNLFYLYQLPIPRLPPSDETFKSIVARAARLVCVSADLLGTFPLVDSSVKEAALAGYRLFAPKSADQKVRGLIGGGRERESGI